MSASPPAPEPPAGPHCSEIRDDASDRREAWVTTDADEGDRLDVAVARRLELPRNRVQRWIREGRIQLSGQVAERASQRVARGQRIEVEVGPELSPTDRLVPECEPLEVLWEDEQLLFVDKPAGLVVHPAPGHRTGTLCHRLVAHAPALSTVGHPQRPGIVHRLDAGTSGVMVIAKTDRSYEALSRAFAERRIDKRYLAFCHGRFREPIIEVDLAIGRHPKDRKRMAPRADGRPARTTFEVLRESNGVSAVAVSLHTGRTHQIRVHLKAARHPLIGDDVYGEERWRETQGPARRAVRTFPRPALHAWRLALDHPDTGAHLAVTSPVPHDLTDLWAALSDEPLPDSPPAPQP